MSRKNSNQSGMLATVTIDNVTSLSDAAFTALVSSENIRREAGAIVGTVGKSDAAAVAALVDTLGKRSSEMGSHAALVRMSKVYAARAAVVERSASAVIRRAWTLGMIGRGKTYGTPRILAAALGVTPSLVSQCKPESKRDKSKSHAKAGRPVNRDAAVKQAGSVAHRDTTAAILAAAASLEILTSDDERDNLTAALVGDTLRAARAILAHAATLATVVDTVDADSAASA